MNLYLVLYDGQPYYIEARTFPGAIDTWRQHVAEEWGEDFDGTEQPESVALVHEKAVIREPEPPTAI